MKLFLASLLSVSTLCPVFAQEASSAPVKAAEVAKASEPAAAVSAPKAPATAASSEARPRQEIKTSSETKKADAETRPGRKTAREASKKDYLPKETYFQLPGTKNEMIDLKDFAGTPVLIMFFTTSCPICQETMPHIEKIYKKYKNAGLNVVGIAIGASKAEALRYTKASGITFPVALDQTQDISENYRVRGVPFIFLLDKEHNVKQLWMGYNDTYDVDIPAKVESLLK